MRTIGANVQPRHYALYKQSNNQLITCWYYMAVHKAISSISIFSLWMLSAYLHGRRRKEGKRNSRRMCMMVSGTAKTFPLLLIASHVYAPSSSARACLIVIWPRPTPGPVRPRQSGVPLSLSVLYVTRGESPTWPKLSRHTISGVGMPVASQLRTIVSPRCAVLSLGGATVILGRANTAHTITDDVCRTLKDTGENID